MLIGTKFNDEYDRIETDFGYCKYGFFDNVFNNKLVCFIYDLYIYKQYRGFGISRRILESAICEIKSLGYIDDIYIESDPRENSISKIKLTRFYKSLGLKIYIRKNDG